MLSIYYMLRQCQYKQADSSFNLLTCNLYNIDSRKDNVEISRIINTAKNIHNCLCLQIRIKTLEASPNKLKSLDQRANRQGLFLRQFKRTAKQSKNISENRMHDKRKMHRFNLISSV